MSVQVRPGMALDGQPIDQAGEPLTPFNISLNTRHIGKEVEETVQAVHPILFQLDSSPPVKC